jgi:hypothetical protein
MPADLFLILHSLHYGVFVSFFECIKRDLNRFIRIMELTLNTSCDADAVWVSVGVSQGGDQEFECGGPSGVVRAVKKMFLILWMFHAAWT